MPLLVGSGIYDLTVADRERDFVPSVSGLQKPPFFTMAAFAFYGIFESSLSVLIRFCMTSAETSNIPASLFERLFSAKSRYLARGIPAFRAAEISASISGMHCFTFAAKWCFGTKRNPAKA